MGSSFFVTWSVRFGLSTRLSGAAELIAKPVVSSLPGQERHHPPLRTQRTLA
jgi:hypothetical protein